jgi:hypothetical protein
MEKTLDNINIEDVKQKVSDVKVFGNGDLFVLIAKASSESQGWMKSTKVMETPVGCVVQVTTQQKNPDGTYSVAEALTFVPGVCIRLDANGNKCLDYKVYPVKSLIPEII